MRIHTIRTAAVAAVAALALSAAGCAPGDSPTSATPAPMTTVPAVDPHVPAPASPTGEATPEVADPTEEAAPEASEEVTSETRVPLPAPQLVSQFVPGTPTPTATSSSAARRSPPPAGSVDCSVARCIALTFDDGPGPHTSRLVGMLTSKGARATFFMQGVMVRANPGIARQVANTPGMEIANHSATHPQLTQVSATQLRREIVGTHATIKEVTGRDVTVFRPPYGARNAAVDAMAAQAGEAVILWDVDTNDWRTRSASATRQSVAQQTKPGSIVLMHDIHKSTVDAVPGIIEDLQGRGYVLVTVSELLGGTTPGRVYSSR